MTTRGHHGILFNEGGVPPVSDLPTEILADSPAFYFRLNEASGTTANNETGGADATYSGGTLNQPAIYPGGDPCLRLSGDVAWVDIPASLLTSATALTLECVISPQSVSGIQSIITRDNGASLRFWQWRLSGTDLQWVKIVGGVQVVTATGIAAVNVPMILHVVIDASGAIELFRDGVSVHTDTMGAADYGDASKEIRVGYDNGPSAGLNAYICEVAGFSAALASSRVLAHAQAAGFA